MSRFRLASLCLIASLGSTALADNRPAQSGPVPFSGDARGFGGGDFLDPRLSMVRGDLLHSLKLAAAKPKELCRVTVCPIGLSTPLCDRAKQLTESQGTECREFVATMAGQVSAIAFEVVTGNLTVKLPDGSDRPVAARTQLGPKGKIQIQRAAALALTPEDLTALVGHELGHKVVRAGKSLEDTAEVAAFGSGKDFLDSVGAALAVFTAQNRVPPQSPPELSPSLKVAYCARAPGASPVALGWAADLTGQLEKLPPAPSEAETARLEAARQWLRSEPVHQAFLTRWFNQFFHREPTADERLALGIQLSQGANLSALYATLMRDPEYINSRKISTDEAFLMALYQDVLGRNPQTPELASALDAMKSNGRRDFLVSWLQENETVAGARVAGWYRDYLNRKPWEAETKALVDQMKSGVEWEAVQASLLSSAEYSSLQKVRAKGCSVRGISSTAK